MNLNEFSSDGKLMEIFRKSMGIFGWIPTTSIETFLNV
jgi:hypothetical protein